MSAWNDPQDSRPAADDGMLERPGGMTGRIARFAATLRVIDNRTMAVIVTAAAAYLGRFGQAIAVLITLPLARQGLHPELFGVWMMLSALLGFMAFADLGIGNGVLNHATKAKATGDAMLLRRTLISGYAITSLIGAGLLMAWLAWARFSDEPTAVAGAVAAENRPEVLRALGVFAVVLALNLPASLIQRVQLGMQQGYLNGLNQAACALLTVALVPLTLHWGGGVAELVLATLGVQALVNILNSLLWLHRHRFLSPKGWRGTLEAKTAGVLLRTGGMFFLLQLSAAFAFQSDAIVITQTLGQSVYGEFAVVQKLFLFISILISAAILGLWPAFGDALASNNRAWAAKALRRGMLAAAVLALLGAGALAIAMPWILKYWMTADFQPASSLVIALAAWTVIDGVASVAAAFMNGANLLQAQLLLAVGMAGAAFAAKWLLTPMLGATGAVVATIAAYCLISVPGQIFIFRRVFNTKE